jgi:hypothetical protein
VLHDRGLAGATRTVTLFVRVRVGNMALDHAPDSRWAVTF